MNNPWPGIARRWVHGLGVRPGELILVRNEADPFGVLQEVLLAIEAAGATPQLELMPTAYLERLLAETPQEFLGNWDRHRAEWMRRIDRVLFLCSVRPDLSRVPPGAREAWQAAWNRLEQIEEGRRLPYLLVAVPTLQRAQQSRMTLERFEAILLPAIGASADELQNEIERTLGVIGSSRTLTVRSAEGHELRLDLGERVWGCDDGVIDARDHERGSIVSNIPAGSIYTTVVESSARGSVWLSKADSANDVTLHFELGRIVRIEAGSGREQLEAMFDRHSGEPRRISHIGIGLNPYLREPVDFVLVDEHIHGALFLALGENRYMGGRNESSLNVDYVLLNATLLADDRVVVEAGKVCG